MQTADKKETSQYLTFTLGDEFFAIEVAHVREVPEVNTVSRIPGMPDFMRGGIPVMDLRARFGLTEISRTLNTRIIVLEPALADTIQLIRQAIPSSPVGAEFDSGCADPFRQDRADPL